jgi:hypothetical protein
MLSKGDTVQILPQYQDPGDEEFTWIVVGDEEKGRVDVSPVSMPMKIKPVYTLEVVQVELVHRGL